MTDRPTLPVPPPVPSSVVLDYDRPYDPWRPVVRLVTAAVVAQGLALVAPGAMAAWTVWQQGIGMTIRLGGNDTPGLVVELVRGVLGAGLAAAGLAAARRHDVGRVAVLWLEPAVVVAQALQTAAFVLRVYLSLGRATASGAWLPFAAGQVAYSLDGLVLPPLVWAVLRRPEARVVSDPGR